MTEKDLSTLLHDHVRDGEPPLGLSADSAILDGRRALRRARVRRAAAGTAIIGATAAAVLPMVLGGGGSGERTRGVDPLTQQALADYDATAMPGVLYRSVGPQVSGELPEIAGDRTFTAYDDQGAELPQRHWDKASEMDLTFGGKGPHRVRLSLMHARSEAEGDARRICAEELASGYAFRCTVETVGGDTVTVSVTAVRPLEGMGWGALTREELASGEIGGTNPSQEPLDRDEVYFMKTVESVHSDTFLTTVQEIVKAPNLTQANAAWRLSDTALTDVVTDPSLVIPEPPQGPNGCAWQLHPENVSCSG